MSQTQKRVGTISGLLLIASAFFFAATFCSVAEANESVVPLTWKGAAGTVNAGVICGDGAVFFSSSNHRDWLPVEGSLATRNYTAALATSDGYFVLVADDGSVSRSASAVASGIVERIAAGSMGLHGLAEVDGRVLAVGEEGTIIRSVDLMVGSWTSVTSPTTRTLRSVATNGSTSTVAVGDGGTILKGGRNGTEWQVVEVDETADFNAVVTEPGGRYLAVGDGGVCWTANPSGTAWTKIESGSTENLHGAVQVAQATVIVGDGRTILYSAANFSSWIDGTVPEVNGVPVYGIHAVAYAGTELIAAGSHRLTFWSILGTVWATGTVTPVLLSSWGRVKQKFNEDAKERVVR